MLRFDRNISPKVDVGFFPNVNGISQKVFCLSVFFSQVGGGGAHKFAGLLEHNSLNKKQTL